MGEESFYVTLPSNVKSNYDSNTLASWKTQLHDWMYLEGDYEVGLAEINFTNSWWNVLESFHIRFRVDQLIESKELLPASFDIPPGRYVGLYHLCSTINNLVLNHDDNATKWALNEAPRISFEPVQGKIFSTSGITNKKNILSIVLDPRLQELIGYGEELDGTKRVAAMDLNNGIKAIYCYIDVIKHRLVGDSRKQLLRVIQIPSNKFGEQIHISYNPPLYQPLNTKAIEEIEIELRDDVGRYINFQFGRSLVVLHFRKIKHGSLF